MNKAPLISIVTVVYNGEAFIEETILSVINQTYKNVEFIVIDGSSNDKTVQIIKKYSDKITYWISEPDKGIYDAMNKGIKAGLGDWFNFLNAGDSFIDNQVLEKIFSRDLNGATLIYGDIKVLNDNGQSQIHKAITIQDDKSIMKGMKVCHQAIFYNRNIINLYDSSLKIKAEWKHLIQMTRKSDFKPLKFNFPFVYYRTGGIGTQRLKLNQSEYRKTFLEEYGKFQYIKFLPFFTWMMVRRLIKNILFGLIAKYMTKNHNTL